MIITYWLGGLVSVVAGAVLALVTVIGGVGAVTSATNPASASENIVAYDAQ